MRVKMKNRALELAMSKGIKTASEFTRELNIPMNEALALLNEEENVKISSDTISKCLKYFNCSYDYFVCIVDMDI